MKYRSEIDGLRAIAVLSVILYHLGLLTVGVGFAGVDVFFVISGYLIGGLILSETEAGSFRFRDFYARRARRIFPALFAVILVTFFVGWVLMLPRDYRYFMGGGFFALLSLSNIWFAARIDYFNPEAAHDPLIHTWTLGVEEQFYLFAPIIIVLARRFFRPRLFLLLATLTLASFLLALWMSERHPQLSFYLLPSRAWELFAGVLIALREKDVRALTTDRAAAVLANICLAALVFGIVAIPRDVDWPGVTTIVPVLATSGLLAFGHKPSFANRLLSLAPLRIVGLVSYSAYLVHQPILGFMAYMDMEPNTFGPKILVLLATFILAYVSWRFIEKPFREKRIPKLVGRGLLTAAAVAIGGMAVMGNVTKGFPNRMSDQVGEILAVRTTFGPNNKRCLNSRADVPFLNLDDFCVLGPDVPPKVAIWGDSHGAAILDSVADSLTLEGVSSRAYLLSSCLPIPGVRNYGQSRAERCSEFNERVLQHIVLDETLEVVVLVATWDSYFLSHDWPNMLGLVGHDSFYSYPMNGAPDMPEDERQEGVELAVSSLIEALTDAGKSVVIAQSNPRPNIGIPRYLARRVNNGHEYPNEIGYDRAYFDAQTALSHSVFQDAASTFSRDQVALVHPEETLCDRTTCKVVIDGEIMYSDDNHLSVYGAEKVSDLIAAAIFEQLRSTLN